MLGEQWPNQYKRMQRSYASLQRAAHPNDSYPEQEPDAARDILYHFCSDALNLRDWIVKTANLSQATRDDVRHLFRSATKPQQVSVALAACADIANGSKHFVLTQTPYTPGGPAQATSQSRGARLPATLPANLGANHWTIDVGGVGHDALDLARQAIADWDTWLAGHGMLPLPTD
jgi:hypothetical protein